MSLNVIRGYAVPTDRKGEVCIYTLDGEKLFILQEDIERSFENEASKKGEPGLTTFFIKRSANVRVEVSLDEAVQPGLGGGEGGRGTIYKFYDDVGTVRKSYDEFAAAPDTITKRLDDGGTISKSRDDGY